MSVHMYYVSICVLHVRHVYRRMSGVLLYHSLPNYPETESH